MSSRGPALSHVAFCVAGNVVSRAGTIVKGFLNEKRGNLVGQMFTSALQAEHLQASL